jgi:DNA-directed RNA polymerase specialized sigma24 family protein
MQFEPARRPDLQTFNDLVLQSQDRAYQLASLYLGDDGAAAELVQAAVRELYAAKDLFRARDFQTEVLRCIARRLPGCRTQNPPPTPAAPENCLPLLLLRLPPADRLAVILVDCLRLDYAGAAQAAGSSLAQVRSALAQGRMRLSQWRRGSS